MGHKSVELFLGVFRVVAFSGQANAESVGNAFDASSPEGLVQGGVDADVRGPHVSLGKGLDDLDGLWGSLFKGALWPHV